MAEQIKKLQNAATDESIEERHFAQLALMTGTLMLARATNGDDISDRFLNAAKAVLLE